MHAFYKRLQRYTLMNSCAAVFQLHDIASEWPQKHVKKKRHYHILTTDLPLDGFKSAEFPNYDNSVIVCCHYNKNNNHGYFTQH